MNILMISRSVYAADVRIRREAETLAEAGHRVAVIGLGADQADTNGVAVLGVGEPSGLKGGPGPRTGPLFRLARWTLLPNHRATANRQFEQAVKARLATAEINPQVVHAHDFPALAIGAEIAADQSARLIYDSHEIWGEMARAGRPEPFARSARLGRERELARSADAVITVGDGAAELLAERLGLSRVTVVRNTFGRRDDLDPPATPGGAVYSGRIARGRDLETVFAAWGELDVELHLIGPSDGTTRLPAHVVSHPPSDLDAVERLTARLGIALVPLTAGPLNHRVALPNKLFQAISVGVPVVAADLPELRRVVVGDDLGRLYQPGDPDSMVTAVRSVIADYPGLVDSVSLAAPAYDWSVDAGKLVETYRSIGRVGGDRPGRN